MTNIEKLKMFEEGYETALRTHAIHFGKQLSNIFGEKSEISSELKQAWNNGISDGVHIATKNALEESRNSCFEKFSNYVLEGGK